MKNNDYPDEPTDIAKIDSTLFNGKLIGENDFGTVHIHGPYGNIDSKIKIAYIIGMHPLESKVHRALFEEINARDDLRYSYVIYNINGINELDEETEGRMEGQLLGQEFIVPHVKNADYNIVVDIHGNKGLHGPGTYEITNFLFAPGFDEKSESYMNSLISEISEIQYYAPNHRTSPPYVTEPIVNSGTPTLIYETYSYEKMSVTRDLIEKLVDAVDGLKF